MNDREALMKRILKNAEQVPDYNDMDTRKIRRIAMVLLCPRQVLIRPLSRQTMPPIAYDDPIHLPRIDRFAVRCGFEDWKTMRDHYLERHGLPLKLLMFDLA